MHCICNLKYSVPTEFPIIIHNGSYCFHLMIKHLTEKFEDNDTDYISEKQN